MRLGVFEVAGVQVGGTLSWPHPRSTSTRFHELDYWVDYAQLLDEAGFDFLFFADGYGYPALDGDLAPAGWRHGINFAGMEPMMLIPTLARETERLGFVVTASTGLDHPVQMARRFGTLDHLTGGRIGWNIVTGANQNVIQELFGHDEMAQHDNRYAIAHEYVDLTTRLLEDVWADDALVMDRSSATFVREGGLTRLEFAGEHFSCSGYYTMDASAQRTPVLFQAGTSPAGRELASTWAEAVFVQATTPERTAASVADIRDRAAAKGRPSPVVMAGATITVAPTMEEAWARRAEFDAMQTDEVVNTLYAGNTGIDLLSLDPDQTLHQVLGTDGVVGQMATTNIDRYLGQDAPTVRQILDDLRGKGTRGFQITGDPTTVADQMEALMASTGLDGFLIEPIFATSDLADFAESVMPILRSRGLLPETPRTGTFRSQLGVGSPENADHRARS